MIPARGIAATAIGRNARCGGSDDVKTVIPRLLAIGVMLVVVGAAHGLKLAGFAHPELDAFLAAGLASILTVASTL